VEVLNAIGYVETHSRSSDAQTNRGVMGRSAEYPDGDRARRLGVSPEDLRREREGGEHHRGHIPSLGLPPNQGLLLRQARALVAGDPEFMARYPELYKLLFSPPHPESRREINELYLPSFGVYVALSAPETRVLEGESGGAADAYSVVSLVTQGRPIDQGFLRLHPVQTRGLLLAILGREEHVRLAPQDERGCELLLEGAGAAGRAPVRLTDLRLAVDMEPGELEGALRSLLERLERPITPDGVVRWKRRLLEERDKSVRWWIDWPETLALVASFSAAALLLFIDMGVPRVAHMTSYRLAEKAEDLADIIRRASNSLDANANRLKDLLADRAKGGKRYTDARYVEALRMYRIGWSKRHIARIWGITPYKSASDQVGRGSRDWKQKVQRILSRGMEVEKERYPQAAAIFENSGNPHIVRKAHLAYRAYVETPTKRWRRENLWPAVGKVLRINTRTDRGVQIALAYIQLGCCLKYGIEPLPQAGSYDYPQPGSHRDSDIRIAAFGFMDFIWTIPD